MRLLTNPVILRMAVVGIAAAVAFVLGLVVVRQLRKSLQEEASIGEDRPSNESFPLHTYHAVIQQLKQQKHELQAQQQAERRRAQTSETLSAAVLSNLSSGVLFFNASGLVRQANPAARNILGFESPGGMSAGEIFRNATVRGGSNSELTPLADAITTSLRNLAQFQQLEADYTTPGGVDRVLEITISPVYGVSAEILGSACLINDQTELARMRKNQGLTGAPAAELATILKTARAVASYAHDLLAASDLNQAKIFANKIAAEAEGLERGVTSFAGAGAAIGMASGRK